MYFPIQLTFFPEPRPAVITVSHERSGTHFFMNALAACYGYVSLPWVNLDPNESSLNIDYFYPRAICQQMLALADRRMANVVKSHHAVEFFDNELAALTERYVVFVVCRDPVAVMLSCWRFMHGWPWNTGPKVSDPLTFARAEPCGWLMRYQMRQYPSMLRRWAAHVESWLTAATTLPRIAIVRYEDLVARYDETMCGFSTLLGRPPQALHRPARNLNVIPAGPDDPTGLGIAPDIDGLRRLCRETVGDTMARLGY